MSGARLTMSLAPGWNSLLDNLEIWVQEEGRDERPEEVRGTHLSCFVVPPETRRPSRPKEEEVRLPVVSMVIGWATKGGDSLALGGRHGCFSFL
jgi:hypothetical protein